MTFVLLSLIILYCRGIHNWLERAMVLFKTTIIRPWERAINAGEWERCKHYNHIAESFPLIRWKVVANPYAWLKYWNWRPEECTTAQSTRAAN